MRAALIAGAALALAGCAGTSASMQDVAVADAFVDPSIYEFYDCKQLATERATLIKRLADNQQLKDKARTGVAGSAVAELAYGNETLSLRGQLRLVDRMWRRSRCDNEIVAPPPSPGAHASGARQR